MVSHWETGGLIEVTPGASSHHPAIQAAIDAATAMDGTVDPACVELAALSSFIERLEQWYRELHQRHLALASR
ncbi:MAG: hypothetical protein JNJ54_30315 [Myxococcaceae bacterium]|nr:hypothetical protein [Myxococcaceae bacterium]